MNEAVNYPDFVARFYDVIYSKIRTGIDDRFFMQEISCAKEKVLEIGVGTGRLFIEALNNGADIYGIDVSKSMVDKLKEKIPPPAHNRVWVQDGVTMKLPYKFDLIIAPFRMLSHIINTDDQLQFLNNVYDHLTPGGKFIFDLYVPNLQMLVNGIDNVMDFEGEYMPGKKITRVSSMTADPVNQISNVTMKFTWDEGGKVIERSWDFKMRFFFRFELEHLVARSKLKLQTIYGDYIRTPLDKNSKDFVVVCGKE